MDCFACFLENLESEEIAGMTPVDCFGRLYSITIYRFSELKLGSREATPFDVHIQTSSCI